MANNDNRGFNTVSDSNVSRRDQRIRLQRMTFIAIVAIAALMVIALLVLIIGSIANGNNPNQGDNPVSGEKPKFTDQTVSAQDTVTGDLVIVNSTHQYTFPTDESHLSNAYNVWSAHTTKVYELGASIRMETTALSAVDKMLTDMAASTGYSQSVLAEAYRTLADQEGKQQAPGYSDHHTGLLCRINTNEACTTWLANNAHKYGFVMRYPNAKAEKTGVSDYESAYRYVGAAHATYMYNNNLCLEEYVEYLKANVGSKDSNKLSVNAADGKVYHIYYYTVNGSATIEVPTNFPYTVSGTNDGGVVVTVCISASNAELQTTADTTATTVAP